ncbi:MAG: septal ring lytic transglycosylase RlpA family protein [Neisseriales bacterium]|nr:MAG: septal ring lytic transglycosylase RlpA family protein [Neisseriales bacterium]
MRLANCLRFTCCVQPQKKWIICVLLYLTIMVPVGATDDACSDQLPTTMHKADHPDPAKPYCKKGEASWYGSYFHGKKTSSGERFDMHEMTAAHRTLPIPSYAKVTNLHNGKSIIVRINDRGPFKKQRIIDLSYAAAHQLGFVEKGHTAVSIEAL